ncbi:APC family permease [Planctomyces sp. SH-PL62]|uniref:APC family permease n=1 Tax=Planctomyces sp. SH-PL62 TaxID=1636152 RepID=UPI00078C85A2|nr:amino acid permease [Planctomyces sp. SH-PL62]AMV38369.1 Serine/threonine exchanger SteT [Planctomyces sp. SH-PL62]
MSPGDGDAPDALPRHLGLLAATAVVVGEVVGIGIFLTPSEMAKSLASPFWLLAAWTAAGGISICGALCFGALAARYPQDGGAYMYLRRAFGSRVAFQYGWVSLLVTDPGITALMAAGMATYVGSLVALSPFALKLVAIGSILALAGVNMVGLRIGSGFMQGMSALKLGLLVIIAVWGFGFGPGSWSNFRPFATRPSDAAPLGQAMAGGLLAAFFSLAGWWDASKLAGEVRDPDRTLPRALLLGVVVVTVVYIMVSAVFWRLVPLERVDTSQGFAAQAGKALFGAAGGGVFSSIVILSALGSLAGLLMAAPRVYYAMARDGLFPAALGAIHPRFGTPARATAIQAVVASVLVATGSFGQILSYFMAVTVAFLALTVVTVYIPTATSWHGRIPGYPLTPLGFIVPAAVVLAMQVAADPIRSGIGMAIVAVGVPIHEYFVRGSSAPFAKEVPSVSPSVAPETSTRGPGSVAE